MAGVLDQYQYNKRTGITPKPANNQYQAPKNNANEDDEIERHGGGRGTTVSDIINAPEWGSASNRKVDFRSLGVAGSGSGMGVRDIVLNRYGNSEVPASFTVEDLINDRYRPSATKAEDRAGGLIGNWRNFWEEQQRQTQMMEDRERFMGPTNPYSQSPQTNQPGQGDFLYQPSQNEKDIAAANRAPDQMYRIGPDGKPFPNPGSIPNQNVPAVVQRYNPDETATGGSNYRPVTVGTQTNTELIDPQKGREMGLTEEEINAINSGRKSKNTSANTNVNNTSSSPVDANGNKINPWEVVTDPKSGRNEYRGFTLEEIEKQNSQAYTTGYNYKRNSRFYTGMETTVKINGVPTTLPQISGYYIGSNGKYYPINLNAVAQMVKKFNWGGGGGGGGGRSSNSGYGKLLGGTVWDIGI